MTGPLAAGSKATGAAPLTPTGAAHPVAVRWGHPDLAADEGPGLSFSARGRVALVAGRDAVRQSLVMLLSTSPGERVMRPDYGCDLQRLLFWPNDATTAGLAIHHVRRAVERFETRVEVLSVDAGADPQTPDRLSIVLAYRILATRDVDEVAFAIDLQGGG
jgi:phage baseplate assembly protein W